MDSLITSDRGMKIASFISDAAEAAAKKAFSRMTSDGIRSVIGRLDALEVAIEWVTFDIIRKFSSQFPMLTETQLLKPVAHATVPARTKPFNAAEFYQVSGIDLYVHDTFADRLDLSARKTADSASERPFVALLLKTKSYDKDILKELPKDHLSTLDDIAGFVEAQYNRESGFLLNNGYLNLFYVEGKNNEVVVCPYWDFKYRRRWCVREFLPDTVPGWNAGYRVFCPGNTVL